MECPILFLAPHFLFCPAFTEVAIIIIKDCWHEWWWVSIIWCLYFRWLLFIRNKASKDRARKINIIRVFSPYIQPLQEGLLWLVKVYQKGRPVYIMLQTKILFIYVILILHEIAHYRVTGGNGAVLKHGIQNLESGNGNENGNGIGNPWKKVPSDQFGKKYILTIMTIKINE